MNCPRQPHRRGRPARKRLLAGAPGLVALAMGFGAVVGPAPFVRAELDPARFEAHCRALTATPHRLAGTVEGQRAADYIESRLRELPGRFFSQRFSFPQQITERCEVRTSDGPLPLQPLAANGMQPSVTPAEGLRGRLVLAGRATPADLEGRDLRGTIAVADFAARGAVVGLFRMGARAVIFRGGEGDDRFLLQDKRTFVSADLPRFYLGGRAARNHLRDGEEVTLISRLTWQKRQGRNLYLWIPGTQPRFQFDREEFLILSAWYDSEGIVPDNSPSPEPAANCAALLEIARRLAHFPPRRSVLVAFFDNHANFLEGGRRFYTAWRRSIPERIEDPLPVRQAFLADERKYLTELLAWFDQPRPFATESRWKDRALQMLREESRHQYGIWQEQLMETRLELDRLRKSGEDSAALEQRVEELLDRRAQWQKVRECVRDRRDPTPEAAATFQELLDSLRGRIHNRLRELDEIGLQLADEMALTAPLAGATSVGHLSLRFGGGGDRWLLLPHGSTHERVYAALLDAFEARLDADQRAQSGFVWESRTLPASFVNWMTIEENVLATPFEIPSWTALTEQDRAERAYLPDAACPPERLHRIRVQAEELLPVLDLLTNDPLASVPNRMVLQRKMRMEDYLWRGSEAEGHRVKSFGFGQTTAERIEPNVLVHVMGDSYRSLQAGAAPGPQYDERWTQPPEYVTYADGNGCFPLLPILNNTGIEGLDWRFILIEAARFDSDGRIRAITVASPTGGRGSVATGWARAGFYGFKSDVGHYSILNLFTGARGMLLGQTMPFADPWRPSAFRLLNGLSNAPYKRQHFRFDPLTGIGVWCIEKPLGVKVVYEDPKNESEVALYLNPTPDRPTGFGYGPGSGTDPNPDAPLDLRARLAPDLFALNESRLAALRSRNIVLNSLESLHGRARDLLTKLDPAREERQIARADDLAGRAATLERRVYRPVMAVTNDMIVAVTILLLLAIPFAFALQSLVLWTYNIYRRLAYFAVFFLVTFGVLYVVHPAFSFATTPIIILLAFVILVMSAGVIGIISSKFSYEIKKLQGLAAAAHSFERSIIGNLGAAVSLAISIMRRRPVRTALTVVTVVFLTFTILSFVSFQTEKGVNRYLLGAGDQGTRLLVHRKVWKSLDRQVLADLERVVGGDARLNGRYWRVKELTVKMDLEPLAIPIRRESGGTATAGALLSLDALEIENIPGLREVLPGRVEEFVAGQGVYLSPLLARELGAQPGDRLRVQGVEVTCLGAFDPRRLSALRELDGSPLLPVNFAVSQLALGHFESKGTAGQGSDVAQADLEDALARLEPQALEPVSADSLVLVPTRLEGPLGMSLKGIVIHPSEGADLTALAEQIAVLCDDGVYLNQGGETTYFRYGDRYGVAGVADVLIPLVLGGLIIFSTMLGSVIDREKEIYTFSALGLAPRTIAMLFFVEASIYAVIGGFGGYLFSQVVTQVLEWLAEHGWFRGPEMNYSSSTAINTILVVMGTVIVSTIYPAIQAARKATADTARRWRMPSPQGDLCEFHFPFTISRWDIGGILCFIREHFVSHADRTVGEFAVDEVELFREGSHGMMALRATIWLQPFDQGISQRFALTAHPSDIEEVCEIRVRIERLSGPPSAWVRSNRVFLENIRRQFLLWRTLDDEEREHYLSLAGEGGALAKGTV